MRNLILTCTSNEIDISNANDKDFPRLCEVSWIVIDENYKILTVEKTHYIYPDDNLKRISPKAKAINGLSIEQLRKNGENLKDVLDKLYCDIVYADYIIGYDVWFIKKLLSWEFAKNNPDKKFNSIIASTPQIDILDVSRKLVNAKYTDIKSGVRRPTLKEVVKKLTNEDIKDNTYDEGTINHVLKCFVILSKIGVINK